MGVFVVQGRHQPSGAQAFGWVVVHFSGDEGIDEIKKARSRLHLGFRPGGRAAEVARLEVHGAQRVDIGQGDQPWVVTADPEGNEFCVLGQLRQ
ncbi:hypothetical protein M2160_004151 [Streptomyces sp. SAI-117]|uniref:VOC family protein n=1 Tax=Streptomyces sp. SAI-117 TaxID=2940546 RepID=UPI0024735E0B|nr:VOC family protein [Streptomyces sp. SAI-117]MDH6569130.1 hypothetical protein [Streptomyces sp. SAI-117]